MSYYLAKMEEAAKPSTEEEKQSLIRFANATEKDLGKVDWLRLPAAERSKAILAWVHDHIRFRPTPGLRRGHLMGVLNSILESEDHTVFGDCKDLALLYVTLARASGLNETRFVLSHRLGQIIRLPGHIWAETSFDLGRTWFHVEPFWAVFGSEFYDCKCHRHGTMRWIEGVWQNRKYYVYKARRGDIMWDILGGWPVVIAEKLYCWDPSRIDYDIVTADYQ